MMLRSFRISSWAGVLDINADYDVTAVNEEVIMNYLNQWKKFMLLVLD